jgi:hypothetical protein
MQYDNNMRGVLFRNDRKEKETHPDYKGSCEIDNVEMWVSAWIKDGKNGKFMSLSFTKKEQAHNNGMSQAKQAIKGDRQVNVVESYNVPEDFEDDLPF